ncbi:S24/S26 family peptidase [Natrinema versiforme]|uniref:Peptidase S24/S26A/S26B, conserved region n=1 Tax=Natrinema versiforme JCM 10478 TaxID=1227496 RepID=L9XVW3_9EURY|nr:S26 family signal peptidase [Natrinema versiforme]ELY65546.1 Peptidase S24/S26A/S26B, conserved region [Natrinema versiforme JCM 10478]
MDGPDGERNGKRSDTREEHSESAPFSADSPADRDSEATDRQPKPGARARAEREERVTIDDDGVVRWLLETDDWTVTVGRDIATCLAIVAVSSLLLFGISGVWPAFVAVESGSMEPNIAQGDLVFIADDDRFVGDSAVAGTGVVTFQSGQATDHEKFANPGDVIVFMPNGDPTETPTIHRAHFWVEAGENWIETEANPEFTNGATCNEIVSCPAPHDGFITKGDANAGYDQLPRSGADTTVVSADWITGKAMARVPWIGGLTLAVGSVQSLTGVGSIAILAGTAVVALALFAMAAEKRKP